jgi:hypothetical protein
LEFVQEVQNQISRKIAKISKSEMYSTKNDLGCKTNKESFEALVDFNNILTNIQVCNPCYSQFNIDEIISAAKAEINKN